MSIHNFFSVCIFLLVLFFGGFSPNVRAADICGKIQSCMDAKNPLSITEYSCTKGDFIAETSLPISADDTAYIVVMSVKFREIDNEIMKAMKELQQQRNTEGLSWVEYINTKVAPLAKKYQAVCTDLGGDLSVLQQCARENQSAPPTLGGFPQTLCNDLAWKKSRAWENMGYILASRGIAKGYQNAKDVHVEKIKGKYSKLLDTFISYHLLLASAVKKLDAYIADPL